MTSRIKRIINLVLVLALIFIIIYGMQKFYLSPQYHFITKENHTNHSHSDDVLSYKYKYDINAISEYELESLPHISKKIAKAIVDFRDKNGDFVYIEDLIYVKGIGEKTYGKIKDYFFVLNN